MIRSILLSIFLLLVVSSSAQELDRSKLLSHSPGAYTSYKIDSNILYIGDTILIGDRASIDGNFNHIYFYSEPYLLDKKSPLIASKPNRPIIIKDIKYVSSKSRKMVIILTHGSDTLLINIDDAIRSKEILLR